MRDSQKMKAKRFMNLRPFVLIAACCCMGLIFAYLSFLSGIAFGYLLLALFVFCGIFLCVRAKKKTLLCIVSLIACVFSFFNCFFNLYGYVNADVAETVYAVDGRIDRVEEKDGEVYRLILNDLTFGGEQKRFSLALYVDGNAGFSVGKRISFAAKIENLGLFFEGRLSSANLVNNIKYRANLSDENYYLYKGGKNLFESGNEFIYNTLKKGLPESEFSVAYALLTGEDSYMDGDTLENFRSGGVAHIFAVSGLHIGVLAAALFFIAKLCRLRGAAKIILCSSILFLYVGICNFTPSSVRAFIMATVFMTAKESGMKYDPLSSLALSAIFVLIFSPLQFFSVGFRLSFSVVFAILLLSGGIANLFSFLPVKISSALGVGISAQIGGIPVSLYYFGTLSPIAVIVNLLAIPAVSFVFVLLFIGVFVGGVFGVPVAALFVQKYILRFIVQMIMIFDYEKLLIHGVVFGGFSAFYYLIVLLLSDKFRLRKHVVRSCAVIFSSFFVGGASILTLSDRTSVKICVSNDAAANCVCFSEDKNACLIISDGKEGSSFYNVKRFLEREGIVSLNMIVLDGNAYVYANAFVSIVENVWYVQEEENYEGLLPETEFYVFSCGESITVGREKFYLGGDGTTLVSESGGTRVLICSSKGDVSQYRGIFDLVVAPQFPEIGEELKASSFALFNPSKDYPNCYKGGNLLYKIDSSSIKRI